MRIQLAMPDNHLVGPDVCNQLFAIHGTTMMFIFAVPIMQGLSLYFVPLMVGTRNTAFPRMTACAYWLYLLGADTSVVLMNFLASPADLGGDPRVKPPESASGRIGWLVYGIAGWLARKEKGPR